MTQSGELFKSRELFPAVGRRRNQMEEFSMPLMVLKREGPHVRAKGQLLGAESNPELTAHRK